MNRPRNSDVTGVGTRIPYELPDFRAVFEMLPELHLIVDVRFTIVAATDAYCRATMTRRSDIVGRCLFEVFPDNPDDLRADGVTNLRNSLLNVIKFRIPHRMDEQKYDIRRPDGVFEERYWRPLNSPILGPDGYVRFIIHTVEDVTELVRIRAKEDNARKRVIEQERTAADLRQSNSQLVERVALLRASLQRLSNDNDQAPPR